jgi:hypothetical protein
MSAIFQGFLAPLFLVFLALIPLVVLLYLLKLRRTHVVVSSTLLWHKSLQDLTANAPFQRLRRNLLLFLQILIIAALAFALARPFIRAESPGGNNICLLVDRSASMQTVEKGRTRLDIAKEQALRLIDNLAGGDKMMVVTFAKTSDVLTELTDDRYRLRDAIDSVRAEDTATHIRDALFVANSLAKGALAGTANLKTILISDGKIEDLEEVGARAFDVNYLKVGETSNNAGIVTFTVREPIEGQTGGERQCLVVVKNDHDQPLEATLTLSLDTQSLAVEEVKAAPKETKELLFALPDSDRTTTGVLRAQLDHEDALAIDNTAWLVLRPAERIKVLLVGQPDSTSLYFLKKVLTLNPRVELTSVAPANYADPGKMDLIIFDGFAPATLPPATLFFINALPPIEGLSFGDEIKNPPVVSTDPEHPVMRFLNPGNVTISKGRTMLLPEGARPLISSRGTTLLADVSRGGRQIIVLAFDISDSNWPLRLSFPLFIQNLLAWAPRKELEKETSVLAGNPLVLLPAAGIDTAEVTLPDGTRETVKLDPTRPSYFANTNRAGLYKIAQGGQEEIFAVNLLNAIESAVAPAESIAIGSSQVAGSSGPVQEDRELWHWLVVGALGVLVLEWWVYSRRAWL